jgi:hypothetical protein
LRRLTAAVALAALLVAAPAATAHEGNPNFLSQVDAITPRSEGVTVEVLNRDDRLLLHNTSGEDIVIEGYDKDQYARVLADGTVLVNTNSPAYYLNEDRFAQGVKPPEGIDGKDAPKWKEVGRNGRFEWHDHRMHWMAETTPPQVRDESEHTELYGWSIPLTIGGERGAIAGTLFWTPTDGGGAPLELIFGIAGVVIAICIAVIVVRRRRAEDTQEPAAAW